LGWSELCCHIHPIGNRDVDSDNSRIRHTVANGISDKDADEYRHTDKCVDTDRDADADDYRQTDEYVATADRFNTHSHIDSNEASHFHTYSDAYSHVRWDSITFTTPSAGRRSAPEWHSGRSGSGVDGAVLQ
jgi:hypothetical protein